MAVLVEPAADHPDGGHQPHGHGLAGLLARLPRHGARRSGARPLVVAGAVFQALPGQNTGAAVAGALTGTGGAAVGSFATHHGAAVVVALVVVEAMIGLVALPARNRTVAATAGFVIASSCCWRPTVRDYSLE
jgi:hypothetical protein